MLKFALKNMLIRRARVALCALSIVLSACVALLAFNISRQVSEGIVTTAGYYDIILGPAGSSTQLAMNTLFFTDEPLGTISYEYVRELKSSGRTNAVIPFTMGDSYNGAKIVGTDPEFLSGKKLGSGEMYNDAFEAVVGCSVAERYRLKPGDTIITSHGLTGTGHAHENHPLTVTGVLRKTSTAYDNVIFTACETVWAVHSHSEEEAHADEPGEVCAILVKSKSFSDYYKLAEYYGENASLLLINPSTVLREVLEQVDLSTQIVYVLCAIILLMNIVVISVITLLNMYDAQKEIALMRLIGVSMKKIGLLYLIQNSLTGLSATLLSLLLSRLCLRLMSAFVASMGIVLSSTRVYPAEWGVMAIVFVISVLPTMIRIVTMSGKDSLNG